jgi:hypothetical protein
MEKLAQTREPAVLLVGRPYNLYDPVVNLDVPRKLRDLYGVNVVPLEFLAADDKDIEAVNANMFWSYGRKILAACREAARNSDLHMIYITNFKCGPDSYIKHFVRDAFGRAFLTLQFDGHANDAGMLTRVEAYLDSQGFLRRWKKRPPVERDVGADVERDVGPDAGLDAGPNPQRDPGADAERGPGPDAQRDDRPPTREAIPVGGMGSIAPMLTQEDSPPAHVVEGRCTSGCTDETGCRMLHSPETE